VIDCRYGDLYNYAVLAVIGSTEFIHVLYSTVHHGKEVRECGLFDYEIYPPADLRPKPVVTASPEQL